MAATSKLSVSVEDSWGVGDFRPTAGFPVGAKDKYKYACPLGPSIVQWDIGKKEKLHSIQCHPDLITILLKSEATNLILSLSYSGHGKVHDQSFASTREFQIPGRNVVYACWSSTGRHFCVCTIGRESALFLYEVSIGGKSVTQTWMKPAFYLDVCNLGTADEDEQGFKETIEGVCDSVDDIPVKKEGVEPGSEIGDELRNTKAEIHVSYYGCIFTNEEAVIAIYQNGKNPSEAHLYNSLGDLILRREISPFGEANTSMLCISECRDGRFAVGLQRGIFVFMSSTTLDIASIFQAQGYAQACLWEDAMLVTASYQSGVLEWWSTSGELLKEMNINKVESVVHLNWSVVGKELWICGITSLNYVFLNSEIMNTLAIHRVAGCGLNFKDRVTLATGDLAGNVMINTHVKSSSTYLHHVNVKNSVRCLCWVRDTLFIGTLEGRLLSWTPARFEAICETMYTFPFSVLTIRTANKTNYLAVGTGGGDIYIFDTVSSALKLNLLLEKGVHKPMKVGTDPDMRPMEIWSVAWCPTDERLVSASEDKTSIVIESKNGNYDFFICHSQITVCNSTALA